MRVVVNIQQPHSRWVTGQCELTSPVRASPIYFKVLSSRLLSSDGVCRKRPIVERVSSLHGRKWYRQPLLRLGVNICVKQEGGLNFSLQITHSFDNQTTTVPELFWFYLSPQLGMSRPASLCVCFLIYFF